MKNSITQSSFNSYYNSQILPELIQFEKYRKSELYDYRVWQISRYLCLTIFAIIVLLFLAYLFHVPHLSHIFIHRLISEDMRIFLSMIIVIVSIAMLSKNRMNSLALKFSYASKYQLFRKIVEAYQTFHYYPLSGIDYNTIYSSNLFSNFNELKSEDFIQGIYKNLEIKLSEIELINTKQHQEIRGNEYITINQKTTIFKGLFIITSVNKSFSSTTYILPNSWLKFLNHLPHYLNRVVLEDPKFENEFDVYSNNQIEARYLLTPSFMERLLRIDKKYQIRCCFLNKQMLIAIKLKDSFFPSLQLTEPLSYEVIKQIHDQFNIIFSIIDDLKLDINIGL